MDSSDQGHGAEPPAYSANPVLRTPSANAPIELPPGYTKVDEHPTSFELHGTMVFTPSGPYYQLSSSVASPYYSVSLRRLSAREIAQMNSTNAKPLAFDKARTLYSLTQDLTKVLFVRKPIDIRGHQHDTLPGIIHGEKSKYVHEHRGGGSEIFSTKTSRKASLLGKPAPIEWLDSHGDIIATEPLSQDGTPTPIPSLVFSKALEPLIRDAIVACWIGRVWTSIAW